MNDLDAATSTFDQQEYRKCLGQIPASGWVYATARRDRVARCWTEHWRPCIATKLK